MHLHHAAGLGFMVTTDDVAPAVVEPVLAPGALIGGRYRIEVRLGAGGGGTVFRCIDQQLGGAVALKVVPSDGDLDRWRREVAMARQITDRNVCRVHDLGETGTVRYVTMELIEGTTLRSKIRADLPAAEARDLIEQLIDGVAAIHVAGVVHRDLKPENVVVTPDGRPVIVDFGIAKAPRRDAIIDAPIDVVGAPATTSSEAMTKPLKGARAPDARRDAVPPSRAPGDDPRANQGALDGARTGAGEPGLEAPAVADAGPRDPADPRAPSGRARDARRLGATLTRAGFAVGTPRYMSPEQASAEAVDARTDVWALGLVAHELLTGAMPELGTDGPVVAVVVDERWPGFAPVLRRCLALDLEDRFADARALKAALPHAKRSKLPVVLALIGAVAVIAIIVKLARGDDSAPPSELSTKLLQVTSTLDKQWPMLSPISVALDATATQLAYTTGGGGVYVRPLAGGAVTEWPPPLADAGATKTLAAPRVIGWFTDGSLAIVGATSNSQRLVRMRATGVVEALHSEAARFHAAISTTDQIAIATARSIRILGGRDVATLPEHSRVVALTWIADQLAWLRVAGGELILERAGTELWRGASDVTVEPLLVAAGDKLVFSFRVGVETTIATIDAAKQLTVVETTPAHVGAGSVAAGVFVVVRGTAREVIQLRDRFGNRTSLAHAPTSRGTEVAGWTTSGSVVMRVDGRVTTGTAGTSTGSGTTPWVVATWPGTTDADLPVAVLDDDVIVRRGDRFDRVSASGVRAPFARLPNATALHCGPAPRTIEGAPGADQTPPSREHGSACVVQQRDGTDAVWSEVDGGRQLHRRKVEGTPEFALSADALVIVTDGELLAIDRATGNPIAAPPPAPLPTRWAAINFDGEGQLWAAAASAHALPYGLVRYRRRADGYSRPSALVTEKDDVLRLFRTPYPTGSERDMKIAVPTLELALEIWRADAPR